uniref:Cystinosin homolog n=1 Tax=Cucumis melo TaxID=3656 RepID=A0A9I9DPC1_CUCME
MASWNSIPLEIIYQVLGWFAFVSWSISFYPQVILNFRRKSVVGLNFDFVLLNLTKHSTYLIYNASLYFSSAVQKQYFEKYGYDQMIPVAANDVAFSIHAVLLTAITLFQIVIYDRGTQIVSKISLTIVIAVWIFAAICFFIGLSSHSWLWLISIFNSIQVFMTAIKYIPQDQQIITAEPDIFCLSYCIIPVKLAIMNFLRKSTDGFSIGNILLDFLGGLANYAQMVVQSIDQNSWVNFYGNIGKTLLSLISIFFDLLFMLQHYVLYPGKRPTVSQKADDESREALITPPDRPQSEDV